jgi:ATP-dependent DNA helicase DinG
MTRQDGPLGPRVEAVFAAGGPLARAFEGYEARDGQQRLAAAVAEAFTSGGVLVAEAGTGIGKTLAYLVPAVLDGRRVLVSTGTRNLQDQVFYKDVPALARAVGAEIRAAYMKGRTNYLCRHRFDRLREADAGLPADEHAWLAEIAGWAAATDTGDRAEIQDLPDDLPLWRELSATSEQCLGRDCPQYADCFVTRMRDRAAAADLVIVNHHLLCADAAVRQGAFGEVIPECDLAVIDEAHQLEDVVTQYFGVTLSTHRVDELAHDVGRAVGELDARSGRHAVAIARSAGDVQQAARRLFDAARLELQRPDGSDRARLTPEMAGRLHDVGLAFVGALDALGGLLDATAGRPESFAALIARVEALADAARLVLAADDPRFVHVVEARGRQAFLRAAPIDVSDIIRNEIVGDRFATVLTSATLTVERSFDYVLGRLGLPEAATLRLPSEFDYRAQAVLYLPPGMPDPRAPDFNAAAADAIAALLERTSGRAFVLFTSYAAMRDVHARLEPRLAWPLLVQGTAPRTALLRDFRATPNAVLLATSSFWQGVDVAGDALSCVIVDRLPFLSPADPLVAARIAAIASRGGQPFHEYQVPTATLTLLQGLGRLIRTKTDRGVLAVLDPRLTRMSYGRRFMASLPDTRITDDLADVERFFA